jgi:hypothetical protein
VSRFPAAVRLPAFASRPSHSRRNSALLTVGLPAKRPDPDGVTAFGTHESRPGWELSLARGQRCSSRLERVPNWRPPHSQRPVPALRHNNPSCGSLHHEASTRVQAIHPSGLPSPVTPGWNGSASAFPELRTPPTRSRTTHVEEGTGHRARTWNNTHVTSDEPPTSCSLVSCDLASHRALQGGSASRPTCRSRNQSRSRARSDRRFESSGRHWRITPQAVMAARLTASCVGRAVRSRLLRGRQPAVCLGDRAKARCPYSR